MRCVFGKNDSIKDIILRDVARYLKVTPPNSKSPSVSTSSLSSLNINEKAKENDDESKKDDGDAVDVDDEKSEEDILFEDILKTPFNFHLLQPSFDAKAIPQGLLEKKGLLFNMDHLEKSCLVVMMPKNKNKQSNSYSRALTI